MPGAYEKDGKYYIWYKDGRGKRKAHVSAAKTMTDARRTARELDAQGERQRRGLDPLPAEDGGGTVGEVLESWLAGPVKRLASAATVECMVRAHLLTSPIAGYRLASLTAGDVEGLLESKTEDLAAGSLNHLRSYLSRAINAARKAGRYKGANPVADVATRKVPKRAADYLRTGEVVAVLAALAEHGDNSVAGGWVPLFACAIFAGLRKGEIGALRKTDVDFTAGSGGIITVQRSWKRDRPKGGAVRYVPIHPELAPFLRMAIAASPSGLVFARPADGAMLPTDVALEEVLRRALGRAGIVTGWKHHCRADGCEHVESATDDAGRQCPDHDVRLWPTATVRPLRFHDLRHSTASLLMQAGASAVAVQQILGHADVRLTVDVYGHLSPEFLGGEMAKLTFGLPTDATMTATALPDAAATTTTADDETAALATPVLRAVGGGESREARPLDFSNSSGPLSWSGRPDLNGRPLAPQGVGGRNATATIGPSPLTNAGVSAGIVTTAGGRGTQRAPTKASETKGAATPVLRLAIPRNAAPHGVRVLPGGADRLLTVRDVAERLAVCRATVYALVEAGALPHVRVANAIRVAPADLAAYVARQSVR